MAFPDLFLQAALYPALSIAEAAPAGKPISAFTQRQHGANVPLIRIGYHKEQTTCASPQAGAAAPYLEERYALRRAEIRKKGEQLCLLI
jgi:hypothetical protein